jgi:hypothetical protein
MRNVLIDDVIAEGERLIRTGKPSGLAGLLQDVNFATVERSRRLPLANLLRRAGLFMAGLRLLTPVVRPEIRARGEEATEDEVAEYASLLMKIGSLNEAINLIRTLSTARAHLYLGFCHMHRWEHAEAAECFRAYLSSYVDSYSAMIARVNLIASLIALNQFKEAVLLLDAATTEARENDYSRLLANLHELRAQVAIEEGLFEDAEAQLAVAETILASQVTNDQLYLMKWRAVIEARKRKSTAPLLDFKSFAIERGDWESAREADLQILRIRFDPKLHRHLFVGSPWKGFRDRFDREWPDAGGQTFIWGDPDADLILNLETGKLNGDEACPRKILEVLRALSRDFYSPRSLGALFSAIFEGEYFHPQHSPNKIHQLLWRARGWLRARKIPIEIAEADGRFSLTFTGPVGVLVFRGERPAEDIPLVELRRSFDGEFSSRDAQQVLGLSEPSVRRLIQRALHSGEVVKVRRGRQVRYQFGRAAA